MTDEENEAREVEDTNETDEALTAEDEYGQFVLEEEHFTDGKTVIQDEQPVKKLRREDIRKPYSKWILFCIETRPKVLQENPGANFKEIANALGSKFKTVSNEDNERLEAAVAADKIRYSKELENALPSEEGFDVTELPFPLAKIKRAAKMDPEVKNIGKDSLIMITKATELFVGHLALKCSANVALRGARSITESDVVNVIHAVESMDFLRIDFPKPSVSERTKKAAGRNKAVGEVASSGKGIMELMSNAKPREYVTEDVSQLTPS